MKLIRFGPKGQEKPGVYIDGTRYDFSWHFEDWNREFFINDGLNKLKEILQRGKDKLPEVAEEVRWGSCVARPNMIMCIGLNYSDHAAESGLEVPKEPILFMKATNTISGPYDKINIPRKSQKTDWEVELAFVLQKDVLYLESEADAQSAIGGYCIMNDISEREFQIERGGQWVKGKSCPDFSPVGPWMTTPDEIGAIDGMSMKLWLNDKIVQQGNTNTMIFKPAYLVYYISQFMQLEAGDIITTGTPPGVGLGMKPPRYITSGDVVRLSIEHLGHQQQHFV
ncbi:fumarylacetoacetate hydrolase family protein [uncultured Salegentibacter sp.]|uniref:fumarylacetoacetate hydrolase family protein n=1 Tax=uncultured Salegentibacter sp. TaxID=259320 RepID=UPI0030DC3123